MKLGSAVAAFFAAMLAASVPAHAAALYPVHGTVVGTAGGGDAVLRTDAVSLTAPARTMVFHGASAVHGGEQIDAFVRPNPPGAPSLVDAEEAAPFIAGLPNHLVTHVLAKGDQLPAYPYLDQAGHLARFADWHGRVVVLSFVFTRCPDVAICPAITGKFSYLQHHLDAKRFHLAEVTLDPPYDSPRVLAAYGQNFGQDPRVWSLLTGRASDVKTTLDEFGISSIEDHPGRYVHDDLLVIADARGNIAEIIPTAGWNPDDVIATAKSISGTESNPFRRLELASIAGIAAFCGGSMSTGIVVLDSVVFIAGVLFLGGLTVWWGHHIFTHD